MRLSVDDGACLTDRRRLVTIASGLSGDNRTSHRGGEIKCRQGGGGWRSIATVAATPWILHDHFVPSRFTLGSPEARSNRGRNSIGHSAILPGCSPAETPLGNRCDQGCQSQGRRVPWLVCSTGCARRSCVRRPNALAAPRSLLRCPSVRRSRPKAAAALRRALCGTSVPCTRRRRTAFSRTGTVHAARSRSASRGSEALSRSRPLTVELAIHHSGKGTMRPCAAALRRNRQDWPPALYRRRYR